MLDDVDKKMAISRTKSFASAWIADAKLKLGDKLQCAKELREKKQQSLKDAQEKKAGMNSHDCVMFALAQQSTPQHSAEGTHTTQPRTTLHWHTCMLHRE